MRIWTLVSAALLLLSLTMVPAAAVTAVATLLPLGTLLRLISSIDISSAYKDPATRRDGYELEDDDDDEGYSGDIIFTDKHKTEDYGDGSGDYYYYEGDDEEMGAGRKNIGGTRHTSPPHSTSLCQRQQLEATVRNQTGLVLYIPQCTSAGQYVPLQCSSSKAWPGQRVECWCVNRYGHEQKGTRVMEGTSASSKSNHQSASLPHCVADLPDSDSGSRERQRERDKEKQGGTVGAIYISEGSKIKGEGSGHRKNDKKKGKAGDISPHEDGSFLDNTENTFDVEAPDRLTGSTNQKQPIININIQSQQKPVTSDRTGLVAGLICGTLFSLLLALLIVLFVIYRLRKKDEGSYALEEPKASSPTIGYNKSHDREFFA